jgi:N-acetylmuramoyl-L-alanine amidase
MAKDLKSLREIEIYFNGEKLPLMGEYFDELGTFCNLAQLVKELNKTLPSDKQMEVTGKGSYITIQTKDYTGPDKNTNTKPVAKTQRLKGKRIALDPGHGTGYNISPLNSKYAEGDFVFKVALELKKMLEVEGAIVLITRTNGTNISLAERAKIINTFNPDIAISIHTNAGGGQGAEVIHSLHRPNDPFSQLLLDEIVKVMGFKKRKIYFRRYSNDKNSSYYNKDYYGIIRMTNAHTVITEAGFHDNKNDLAILMKSNAHVLYATALFNGLMKWFNKE